MGVAVIGGKFAGLYTEILPRGGGTYKRGGGGRSLYDLRCYTLYLLGGGANAPPRPLNTALVCMVI